MSTVNGRSKKKEKKEKKEKKCGACSGNMTNLKQSIFSFYIYGWTEVGVTTI
jgi:hypothetical protein